MKPSVEYIDSLESNGGMLYHTSHNSEGYIIVSQADPSGEAFLASQGGAGAPPQISPQTGGGGAGGFGGLGGFSFGGNSGAEGEGNQFAGRGTTLGGGGTSSSTNSNDIKQQRLNALAKGSSTPSGSNNL